jgi:hypothetical protein
MPSATAESMSVAAKQWSTPESGVPPRGAARSVEHGQHHEDKQNPEGRGRNHEEVDGSHRFRMIHQEGSPSLRRRLPLSAQIFGHRRWRHLDSQLEQFSVNAGCSPQRVRLAHATNQVANLFSYVRSSRAAS